MKMHCRLLLDFVVDKLTNSIEHVKTGKVYETVVSLVTDEDLTKIAEQKRWDFDWNWEAAQEGRSVFKLTIVKKPAIIHGLISMEPNNDHIFLHLIENSPQNKGHKKRYAGVADNMVAYACKKPRSLKKCAAVGLKSK